MKNHQFIKMLAVPVTAVLLIGLSACSSKNPASNAKTDSGSETVVYGKVTAIDGAKITLSMGTISMPERPDDQNKPEGTPQATQSGTKSTPSVTPDGTPPSDPQRRGIGFTSNGETKTITIDISILKKQDRGMGRGQQNWNQGTSPNASPKAIASPRANSSSQPTVDPSRTFDNAQGLARETSASLSDISVGSILRITYQGDTIISVVILST